ncbi:MAG: hypothetical protein WCE90_05820 [Candidatus Zixiibacteriota bacterium]
MQSWPIPRRAGVLLFLIFCLLCATGARTDNQVPSYPQFVFPRQGPVLSEGFQRRLSGLSPQDKVKVWVFFTDKGFSDLLNYQSAISQSERALTSRAAHRRAKTMPPDLVDFRDLPVYQAYIDRILGFEAKERQRSRWLNAASFELPAAQISAISQLGFVRAIQPVLGGKREPIGTELPSPEVLQPKGAFALNYGNSYSQLQQINIPAVHNLGYYGQGVIVCMMDAGFRKDHQAFQLAFSEGRVLAEWDFVNHDGNTQNQPGDPPGQHDHGTMTWSTLGGRRGW